MNLWIKFGLAVTTIIAGFIVLLILLVDRRSGDALQAEHESALVQIAEQIAVEIGPQARLGEWDDLARRLKEHKERNEQILYLFVKDGSGAAVAHTFSGDAPPDALAAVDLARGRDAAAALLSRNAIHHVAVRIAKGLDAELHMGTLERRHQGVVRSMHREILAAGILFIVLGTTLGFGLGYYMMRPMRQVIDGMRTIGSGNLDHRIPAAVKGEAGMLARAFNEMADKRREAEDQIVQMNFELDERVQQRTSQLEAANKEMEAFAYSVSHDLRAPLRSIDGFSKALLDDYADKLDAEGKDHLRRVRKASQRMGQLIDDILKLSRLTRGEMLIEQVDLSALVRDVVKPFAAANPDRKVKMHIQEGVSVRGDRKMLRVVLENLLSNAWKYTGKQQLAWITFGTAPSTGGMACFIKDNGAGFDMAFSQKLFAPFQRLHAEKDFPGTGVGLATVQRIIHRHGGEIWAESEPGKGATFYFTLGREDA